MNNKFSFTITDVARFLGKSPVTLRGWEKKGLISFPRDPAGDRKFNLQEVRQVAILARKMKRISENRLKLIEANLTMLELVERENNVANRTSRSARGGQDRTGSSTKNKT
jgi:hypothetical protein